jgi:hypothetical protein
MTWVNEGRLGVNAENVVDRSAYEVRWKLTLMVADPQAAKCGVTQHSVNLMMLPVDVHLL